MRWTLACIIVLVAGCLGPDGLNPPPDAGPSPGDAEAGDASAPDAAPIDGGTSDTRVTVDVSSVFTAGTTVRDAYSGASGTVGANGMLELEGVDPRGLLLLEKSGGAAPAFSWNNATVYFLITDRFFNGDTSNDHAYGREDDGAEEIATFHGGDLKGITQKLEHIDALGATAVWITPPVQQIGGWIPGGGGAIKSYPYHGYWALDFTQLDANFGTEADMLSFVDGAHQRGLRVVVDTVLNHPGYATMTDIETYLPEALSNLDWESWTPGAGETLYDIFDFVDFNAQAWDDKWWGPKWVRADLGVIYDYSGTAATNVKLGQVAFLPDFKTEEFRPSGFSPLLAAKMDTQAVPLAADATVRDYLVQWHTDWVRRFGFDGYRIDTVKHVENATWAALKDAAQSALQDWRTANPSKKLDDVPFWMVGEAFPPPQGLEAPEAARAEFRNLYSAGKFDAMINFDFNARLLRTPALVDDPEQIDELFMYYATEINGANPLKVMSYISSHDTYLYFEQTGHDLAKQYRTGTWLMMMPGPVQIFYGDETGRAGGPNAGEMELGTRSDMNWASIDAALLAHWQKLGQFRKKHTAIGAGTHRRIARAKGYAFARELGTGASRDAVMIVQLDPTEL